MRRDDIDRRAEPALLAVLADVPFLEVTATTNAAIRAAQPGPTIRQAECSLALSWQAPDRAITIKTPGGEQVLLVEVKQSGEPRFARAAVNQLARYREAMPGAYGVFVAPYISPRGAAICEQDDVGYLDLAGNCRLVFDGVYVRREGRPNPLEQRRGIRSLYSPKAGRVLRVLLCNPRVHWKVQDLAKEAGVSLGQASNVKRMLADREWVRAEPGGFVLTEPGALLEEWAENYSFRRNRAFDYYSLSPVQEIERTLGRHSRSGRLRCALTGFSAAARWAPFTRYQRVMAYADGEPAVLAESIQAKPVTSGANLTLLVPYDEGVFHRAEEIDGALVVSPVQSYLDLRHFRGRGEEAAEFLLREKILPEWR